MIRAAAAFLVRKGPSTGEDRWENTPGLSPYTLATEVAALVVAARFSDEAGDNTLATYFRETADLWSSLIDEWTYVTGTELAKKVGVDGYYIRIAPSPGMKSLRERGEHPTEKQARFLKDAEVVSPDALALVRFGLRDASDKRILNTLKVIDAINTVNTPSGPCWHRYNGDYYGESDTGEPFTGKSKNGHGRAWPLLTGERGHFEIAAGNFDEARNMLTTLGGLCSQTGLLPEQVWDSADISEHHLFLGRPAGSAMPLAWAHSEYVRLLRSLRDKKVFDLPIDSHERYIKQKIQSGLALWRFEHQPASISTGKRLRIELWAPGIVRYSTDNWVSFRELSTCDPGLGIFFADLPTSMMKTGDLLSFTFRWPQANDRWEGRNFSLPVEE